MNKNIKGIGFSLIFSTIGLPACANTTETRVSRIESPCKWDVTCSELTKICSIKQSQENNDNIYCINERNNYIQERYHQILSK